jgi:hypothetical protein
LCDSLFTGTCRIFTLLYLSLREEHRWRVFENRVLRRIFGLKRDEVTRECRKLHDEELVIYTLCQV